MSMSKHNQFVMIPKNLGFNLNLQHVDIRVYFALRSYRDESRKSTVYPARSTLAKRIGCHPATIDRSIKRLEALGFIKHDRGRNGRANTYHFLTDSSTHAAMAVALVQLGKRTDAEDMAAPVHPHPEPKNQTQKPEAVRLYHRSDLAIVSADGSIRIRTHTGAWVDYGGGDDDGFRFGDLRGVEARRAAVKRYSGQTFQNP